MKQLFKIDFENNIFFNIKELQQLKMEKGDKSMKARNRHYVSNNINHDIWWVQLELEKEEKKYQSEMSENGRTVKAIVYEAHMEGMKAEIKFYQKCLDLEVKKFSEKMAHEELGAASVDSEEAEYCTFFDVEEASEADTSWPNKVYHAFEPELDDKMLRHEWTDEDSVTAMLKEHSVSPRTITRRV